MGHSVNHYVRSLARSLATLTPLTHSAALHFAMLASLACSVHGLAHSLCSLPYGKVKFIVMYSRWQRVQREQTHDLFSLETRPKSSTYLRETWFSFSYAKADHLIWLIAPSGKIDRISKFDNSLSFGAKQNSLQQIFLELWIFQSFYTYNSI